MNPTSGTTEQNRTAALVTGGARGIGREVAGLLHAAGWNVAIADRDLPSEDEAREDSRLANFFPVRMDVCDSASVDAGVAAVLARFGRIDGLVNAAGYNRHEPVAEAQDATWQELFEVHLGGTLRCCRSAFAALRDSPSGVVVNFSSVAGRRGRPNRGPYSAAKAGIEALTRTTAIEWAPYGIRVNAVVPGWINTRLVQQNLLAGRSDASSLFAAIPLKRFGEPSEVASVVGFLMSAQSSYMTGQSLVVDGGALINGNW